MHKIQVQDQYWKLQTKPYHHRPEKRVKLTFQCPKKVDEQNRICYMAQAVQVLIPPMSSSFTSSCHNLLPDLNTGSFITPVTKYLLIAPRIWVLFTFCAYCWLTRHSPFDNVCHVNFLISQIWRNLAIFIKSNKKIANLPQFKEDTCKLNQTPYQRLN